MRNRNLVEICKNAVGTVFLLAGAFFVCSTLLSMRAVFADPIAPVQNVTVNSAQSPRAGNTTRASGRATPRTNVTNATVARTTAAGGRTVSARPTNASRGAVSARNVVSRGTTGASHTAVSSRNVVSRNNTGRTTNTTRNVVARTATTTQGTARVSLTGSAIRGSTSNITNSYSYLTGKLYTGNYSNIIDSTTGLISAEAYSNCMESYYTCMDEICTARNASQGRCSCAARAKSFAQAESQLEQANEELIKVSGELALLVATKGKDVSAAFQLTDAEKVMNCVSWQEANAVAKSTNSANRVCASGNTCTGTEYMSEWCQSHGIYDGSCGVGNAPLYCSKSNNNFGFDISDIEGGSSDILASLQAWAASKESASKILLNDNFNLFETTGIMNDVISGMGYGTITETATLDSLANTWGYELFEYAHNNVCSRVLDSCFNGIYEACGTPPSGGRCANGATSSCPFNYNSKITVSSAGDVTLNERGSTSATSNSSASCLGYGTSSGDPYSTLRGPVADARRSVMQKYLLDANAACDVYGDQLRTTAQNIGYQKVAAQQALQQKRLEFAQEEETTIAMNYRSAISNFNECLSELYDCYTTQAEAYENWSTSRIKSYCQQVANVPHCYEQMICTSPNSTLQAVIDVVDSTVACDNSTEYSKNNCRNIITISEILSSSFTNGAAPGSAPVLREACMQNYGIDGVRSWTRTISSESEGWADSAVKCPEGTHREGATACVSDVKTCQLAHAATATVTWSSTANGWGTCTATQCDPGWKLISGTCNTCDTGAGYEMVGADCVKPE